MSPIFATSPSLHTRRLGHNLYTN